MHRLKSKLRHALRRRSRSKTSGSSSPNPTNLPASPEVDQFSTSSPRNDRPEPAREADLWGKAFDQLSEEQKTSLSALMDEGKPKASPRSNTPAWSITKEVIDATKCRQRECESRFWRFPLGQGPEREVILREQTANVIAWVTKAGDIGMEFAPSLAKQVWPCVKAILQIPVKEAQQMAAVLGVADKVSRVAARGRVYEASYTTTNTSAEALKSLRETLVELYRVCLGLLATAAGLLDDNLMQRTVHSILHPEGIANAAGTDLAHLEERLVKDGQAASAATSERIFDQLGTLKAPVARIDENIERLLKSVDAKEELEILEWISMVQYHSHHDKLHEERMAGTCNWLLHHPKFRDWETSAESALMWLQGPIGTGKSFLTSKVIDDYMTFVDKDPNQAFAFFYFKRDDSSRNTALSCLRSIVRQLSTSPGRPGHIQATLRKLCIECQKKGRELSWDLSKQQLEESLHIFPRTTIIIDALDECTEDHRTDLVGIFSDLMATSTRLLVFISGRPDTTGIQRALQNRTVLKIGTEDNQDDIERYVREKIANHRGWDDFRDTESTKETFILTLRKKSQGMFRWTALQVAELFKLRMEEDVSARLGKLPADLTAAYEEIYSTQVKSQGDVQSAVAERALIWVLVACKPLNSAELLSAVRIDVGHYNEYLRQLDPYNGDSTVPSTNEISDHLEYVTTPVGRDSLQEFCANFLTWDSKTDTWTFAHASVAEYIVEHQFSMLHAHSYVVFACILLIIDLSESVSAQRPRGAAACLWLTGEQKENSPSALSKVLIEPWTEMGMKHPVRDVPLVDYAICNWGNHIAHIDGALGCTGEDIAQWDVSGSHTNMKTDRLGLVLENFLGPFLKGSPTYISWTIKKTPDRLLSPVWLHDRYAWASMWPSEVKLLTAYPHAESVAVTLRSKHCFPSRWQQLCGQQVEFIDGGLGWPDDCEIDAVDFLSGSWNLLHVASFFGPVQLVTALLEAGMDINERTSDGRLPLTLAQQGQCQEASRILFDRGGYDPNSLTDINDPLYQAVMNKNADFARYLRSIGAQAIPRTSNCPIYLQTAHQTQARLPWQDSDAQPDSALIKAASSNNMELVRILVEEGNANPEFRTSDEVVVSESISYDVSPLIAASYADNVEVARYLLDNGAAVDTQVPGGVYHTALVAALSQRYLLTMREPEDPTLLLLLDRGADTNLQLEHGDYGSALALTAGLSVPGSWDPDLERHDALDYLCWRLKTLIKYGADVNMVLKHGAFGSALVAAAGSRFRENLEILVNAGADPNLPLECGEYGSPLICAAAFGHAANVQYLLSVGAEINFTATWGLFPTALVAAANSGYLILFRYLESRGADVDKPENQGAEELLHKRIEEKLGSVAKRVYSTTHFTEDLRSFFSQSIISQ